MRATRRQVLGGAAALLAAGAVGTRARASAVGLALTAERRVLEVKGRPATVAALRQPNGTFGARFRAGERFRVALRNALPEPTLIHWHGLRPPVEQDGVPALSQPLLPP